MSSFSFDPIEQLAELDFLRLIYLLLAMDQLDSGVWGASIEDQDRFYGEKHDPGSISVSVNSALALSRCRRSGNLSPISRLRSYLTSRRSANGAFGMMRSMGSADYPAVEVLEHARHTAGAIRFFSKFDSHRHPYVVEGLSYLLNRRSRTPGGLWVDYGSATDERVDPVTVSAVVECLEEALAVWLSRSESGTEVLIAEARLAIRRGLEYLFKTAVRTQEGMWLYRYASEQERLRNERNAYRYTMGIAAAIVRSCQRTQYGLEELVSLEAYARDIFQAYGGFIPNSAHSREPSISASLNFIAFSRQMSGPSSTDSVGDLHFIEQCKTSQAISSNSAPGWAAILSFLCSSDETLRLSIDDERALDHAANELRPAFLEALHGGEVGRFIGVLAETLLEASNHFSSFSATHVVEMLDKSIPGRVADRGMRILFLAANPSETSPLDLEEELRGLEEALRGVRFRDSITMLAGHAVRPDDLVRLVRREGPNVVHFSGHGSAEGIILRTDTGGFQVIGDNNLRQFLDGRGVQLVVLNACYSRHQADAILSAAEAVVGTTDAVGDEAARRFTVAFYRSLGDGLSIRDAFRDGCDAVALHGLSDVFYSAGKLSLRLVGRPAVDIG